MRRSSHLFVFWVELTLLPDRGLMALEMLERYHEWPNEDLIFPFLGYGRDIGFLRIASFFSQHPRPASLSDIEFTSVL